MYKQPRLPHTRPPEKLDPENVVKLLVALRRAVKPQPNETPVA